MFEAPPSVYDEMHAGENVGAPIAKSFFYRLYGRVVDEVKSRRIDSVLEVGCGSGGLAQLLIAANLGQYRGFDFSPTGVRRAAERCGDASRFFVSDARDPASYELNYTGIICTEVLEHISADLDVVSLWRPGTQCVCSVPNFPYPTHVRHFRHESEVQARYGALISIDRIVRVPKPVFAGNSLREYLRKVRWARNQPKKMFGLLGINTFDWYSGWFLFSGTRTQETRPILSTTRANVTVV